MGGGNWVKELDSVSLTPESALSVENKIEKFKPIFFLLPNNCLYFRALP